jgi:hypothetical protein
MTRFAISGTEFAKDRFRRQEHHTRGIMLCIESLGYLDIAEKQEGRLVSVTHGRKDPGYNPGKIKPANDCDINDRVRYPAFESLIEDWRARLVGEDVHSIQNQLQDIVWNDAIYRCYNEALHIRDKRATKQPVPSTIIELLHESVFLSQAVRIRRLTDRQFRDPDKEVISLVAICDDIEAQAECVTRENYVCYDGARFDVESNEWDWRAKMHCRARHDYFDVVSGIDAASRARGDLIDTTLFGRIRSQLDEAKDLRDYINKYVAHAAAPDNREKLDPKLQGISLNYLQKLYKIIIWAAQILSKLTDSTMVSEVATPQFDQFAGWETMFARSEVPTAIYRYWDRRVHFFRSLSYRYSDPDPKVLRTPFVSMRRGNR